MSGHDIWAIARWVIGLPLIGLGTYSLITGRMPRRSRPRWSFPFPAGTEHRGRSARVLALICIAAGFLAILAQPD
jgi:hypothetical protein